MDRILVLHTGGTISMVAGPNGLEPASGVLERALARMQPETAQVSVLAFDPLIDSARMGPDHWNRILDHVAAFDGDGVIVTHGTDTMAFTGAALAQALAGIGIPVVLTGAMQPLGCGGDAEANLALALETALSARAGVWLAFAGRVLAADGLVKHDSHGADSFRGVAQAPLSGSLRHRRFANRNLAILSLSPRVPARAIAAALGALDGAVLRVFGAGTIPDDPALIAALTDAVAAGCRIRAVSQCETGGLEPGAYAAGAALWQTGVENGGTETPEAALVRLWLELSQTGSDQGG